MSMFIFGFVLAIMTVGLVSFGIKLRDSIGFKHLDINRDSQEKVYDCESAVENLKDYDLRYGVVYFETVLFLRRHGITPMKLTEIMGVDGENGWSEQFMSGQHAYCPMANHSERLLLSVKDYLEAQDKVVISEFKETIKTDEKGGKNV